MGVVDTRAMPDGPLGEFEIRRFASIDSTNRYLLDEARAGAPEGVVAVADHQDAGRGRLGRVWSAPPGSSLLVSVLLRPAITPDRLMLVTMAAGVALAEAVEQVAGFPVALKWPNDLVVDDRKLAGLLAEADLGPGAGGIAVAVAVVVGAGCNVQWERFPTELEATATACNLEAGRPVDRDDLLDAYLARLALHYGALDAVAPAYRARLATVGRRVRVDLAGGAVLVGTAVSVDDAGRLVVEAGDGTHHDLAAGDVHHLRPGTSDPAPQTRHLRPGT
jgi:BirA family transcriptional regulator, biotin operon repressor / biotin---[acetyl-CoA-carboxylase] ligase